MGVHERLKSQTSRLYCVYSRVILKWLLKKSGECGLDLSGSGWGAAME